MVGGPLMVISFFWFGWTCYASVSYWAPLLAALPLGLSVQFIFLSLFTNVVDSYLVSVARFVLFWSERVFLTCLYLFLPGLCRLCPRCQHCVSIGIRRWIPTLCSSDGECYSKTCPRARV